MQQFRHERLRRLDQSGARRLDLPISNRREALTRRAVGEASDVGLDIDEPIRIYPVTDGKTDHRIVAFLNENPVDRVYGPINTSAPLAGIDPSGSARPSSAIRVSVESYRRVQPSSARRGQASAGGIGLGRRPIGKRLFSRSIWSGGTRTVRWSPPSSSRRFMTSACS